MDFPGLVRDYRGSGATVVFVPAWDFGRDAWLHSRMAITRGVENGFTVVRAARQGALTVSDPHGRVMVEARTIGASVVSVTTDLPRGAVSTLYTKFGDWLAWICNSCSLRGLSACSLPESLVGSATRRDVLRLAGGAVPSTVTLPRPFTIPLPVPPVLRPARSNATARLRRRGQPHATRQRRQTTSP